MHCGDGNVKHKYFFQRQSLMTVGGVRDLGVITTPDFSHSEVAAMAARQTNFIVRCFVLTGVDVYLRLFQTYVLPLLAYCSAAWNPRYKKDKMLIQSLYGRLRKRVPHRCDGQSCDTPKMDMDAIFSDNDRKMFTRTYEMAEFCNPIFDSVKTRTRSACMFRTEFVGKNEKVSNLFPWRVTRSYFV